MPAKGVSMRKLKQLVRLHVQSHLSTRHIARSLGISVGAVSKYVSKIKSLGLSGEELLALDEAQLQKILQSDGNKPGVSQRLVDVNFATLHQQMKRKGITMQLLWEEYADGNDAALSYSRFCHHYRQWKACQPSSMRQTHKAGDKVFVDYSGQRVELIDPDTGEIRTAEVFIGVLGASNFTYAEATWTQQLPDWIGSQQRMFDYFGCVSALIVPDNLKSAIHKSCRYEPDVNVTYSEFVAHYGTAVLPARPYRPRDKAKAEAGVQLVQRWILARLRHQTFMGLGELNREIKRLLELLNDKPFKKLPGSRRSAFESIDKPAMRPLPQIRYEYRHYKQVRVNIDYHIELNGHYYSVPFQYCRERLDLWYSQTQLCCYRQGQCIARHAISSRKGAHTTIAEHMPTAHRKHMDWTPGRFLNWAQSIGPDTVNIIRHLLEGKAHPEQAYRACLGLLNLARQYGKERLEAACHYGWRSGVRSRKSIASILKNGLDRHQHTPQQEINLGAHENVRGATYYH